MTSDVGPRDGIFDERKRKLIVRAVKKGVPKRRAAAAIGVHPRSLDRWMRDGAVAERRQEEGLPLSEYEHRCRAFRALVQRAEQQWASGAIIAVQELAVVTRRPAVVLEILRRHPVTREEWNVPQKLELTPLQSDDPPELSDEELAAKIAQLHRISLERVRHNEEAAAEASDVSS